jgi:hypothetical protein
MLVSCPREKRVIVKHVTLLLAQGRVVDYLHRNIYTWIAPSSPSSNPFDND